MIAIVRMKAQEEREALWEYVLAHTVELQQGLSHEGRLLYLSQRAKHEDTSLFVHVANTDVLGSLVADYLSKIEGLTSIWVINLLKPVFFPLPRDTRKLRRYAITARVFPPQLAQVYESLRRPDMPPGLLIAYLALTCHLHGDCLQFSVLAEDEERMNRYMADNFKALPGVLHTTISFIERTKPLVSYDEWKKYSTRHSLVPSWSETYMIEQFR